MCQIDEKCLNKYQYLVFTIIFLKIMYHEQVEHKPAKQIVQSQEIYKHTFYISRKTVVISVGSKKVFGNKNKK